MRDSIFVFAHEFLRRCKLFIQPLRIACVSHVNLPKVMSDANFQLPARPKHMNVRRPVIVGVDDQSQSIDTNLTHNNLT